jgi:hypothetical protein
MPARRRAPKGATRAADAGMRVEVRRDRAATPGNVAPALARLLRSLRDQQRHEAVAGDTATQKRGKDVS